MCFHCFLSGGQRSYILVKVTLPVKYQANQPGGRRQVAKSAKHQSRRSRNNDGLFIGRRRRRPRRPREITEPDVSRPTRRTRRARPVRRPLVVTGGAMTRLRPFASMPGGRPIKKQSFGLHAHLPHHIIGGSFFSSVPNAIGSRQMKVWMVGPGGNV